MSQTTYLKPSYQSILRQNFIAHLKKCREIAEKKAAPRVCSVVKIHKAVTPIENIKFLNMQSTLLDNSITYDPSRSTCRLRIHNENLAIYDRLKNTKSCLRIGDALIRHQSRPELGHNISSLTMEADELKLPQIASQSSAFVVGSGPVSVSVQLSKAEVKPLHLGPDSLFKLKLKLGKVRAESKLLSAEQFLSMGLTLRSKKPVEKLVLKLFVVKSNDLVFQGRVDVPLREESEENLALRQGHNVWGNVHVRVRPQK